jgi:hypothetical protein
MVRKRSQDYQYLAQCVFSAVGRGCLGWKYYYVILSLCESGTSFLCVNNSQSLGLHKQTTLFAKYEEQRRLFLLIFFFEFFFAGDCLCNQIRLMCRLPNKNIFSPLRLRAIYETYLCKGDIDELIISQYMLAKRKLITESKENATHRNRDGACTRGE